MIKINGNVLDKAFQFPGGERQIRLGDMGLGRGWDSINIKARVKSSNDLMDLLLVSNAIKHKFNGQYPVYIYLWYLPYARQDRICATGEANGSQVMSSLISLLEADSIHVADIHSPQILPENVVELSALDILKEHAHILKDVTALVSPDRGAEEKVYKISREFNIPYIACYKQRDPFTGAILSLVVEENNDLVSGSNLLVIDDICDGGGTFNMLADTLGLYGNPKSLNLYVTHGIFSKGLSDLSLRYDKIYTTDSFSEVYDDNKLLEIIIL